MEKSSMSGMMKAILIVAILGLIVGLASYMNTNSNKGSAMDLVNLALSNPKAYAYGVNECGAPIVPGTSMTIAAMEYYLAYHLTATNFTKGVAYDYAPAWYTCPVFNIMNATMKAQPAAWYTDVMIPLMEGTCDIPDQTDAPATYCGVPNPA